MYPAVPSSSYPYQNQPNPNGFQQAAPIQSTDPILANLQPYSYLATRGGWFPNNVYIGMEPCYLAWGTDDVLRIFQPERTGMAPVKQVPLSAVKAVRWENGYGRLTVTPNPELYHNQQISSLVSTILPLGTIRFFSKENSTRKENIWMQAFQNRGITTKGFSNIPWWSIPAVIGIFLFACFIAYLIGG